MKEFLCEVNARDGEVWTFNRLTMGDMLKLSAQLHTIRKSHLAEQLSALQTASGIEQDQLPMVVAEFMREPSLGEVRRWLTTPDGARRAAALMTGQTLADIDESSKPRQIAEAVLRSLIDGAEEESHTIPLSEESGVTIAM